LKTEHGCLADQAAISTIEHSAGSAYFSSLKHGNLELQAGNFQSQHELKTRKARLFGSLNARFSVPVSAAALLAAKRYSFLPV
jgi:hypothetical protein